MCTHRLRRIRSFVEIYIDEKYPMYLNDLFAVNKGSTRRKLKMLVQPKYKILNTGVTVFGVRVLAYGTD